MLSLSSTSVERHTHTKEEEEEEIHLPFIIPLCVSVYLVSIPTKHTHNKIAPFILYPFLFVLSRVCVWGEKQTSPDKSRPAPCLLFLASRGAPTLSLSLLQVSNSLSLFSFKFYVLSFNLNLIRILFFSSNLENKIGTMEVFRRATRAASGNTPWDSDTRPTVFNPQISTGSRCHRLIP